ncbi:MAG: hypothetical protein VX527_00370 [Planctomycetota bacterium]|nr:hypothetical protein [Planctomycetota bacterium]
MPMIRVVPPSRRAATSGLPESIKRETRRSLKLPESGPIIATGHAPMHWHPGILAKFMAMRVLSQEQHATPLVLNIDTVTGDPGLIEVPFIDRDGLPCSSTIRLFDSNPDVSLGMQPATEPADLNWLDGIDDFRSEPLVNLSTAVHSARGDLSLASQLMRAQLNLARSWTGRPTVLGASKLLKTACGRWLLELMQRDTARCSEAYNAAVSVDPDAGIRPLDMTLGELPLWDIRSSERRTARRQDLDEANLLPKALMITAIMRLAGCDLFLHGTGGARYDALMEGWIRQWLGIEVMPFMVVTADVLLPMPDVETIARLGQSLVARGRRAYHDPESVEETADGPGPQKRAALESIESAPRGSEARREAYASMHETLATLRVDARETSMAIAGRVRDARRTIARRDWDFFFHPEEALDVLADEVENRVLDSIR